MPHFADSKGEVMRKRTVLIASVFCALSGEALAADIKPCDVKNRNEGLKCLRDNIKLINDELIATRVALTAATAVATSALNTANNALPNQSKVQMQSYRYLKKCLDQPLDGGGADRTNATDCSNQTVWRIEKQP